MTDLYRIYDIDEQLLYIGISEDVDRRINEHRLQQPWGREIIRWEAQQRRRSEQPHRLPVDPPLHPHRPRAGRMTASTVLIFPDTGEPAWWCICAKNEADVAAIGPFRTVEAAVYEAEWATRQPGACGNHHFTSQRITADTPIHRPTNPTWSKDDWRALHDQIVALHNSVDEVTA